MNQENHPKEFRTNDKGANRDVDVEILGANPKSGQYINGRNLRVSSINSNRSSAEKIKGEQVVHSNFLAGNYESIKSASVNGKKIEFWVDANEVGPPTIIIDGVIVAQSDKIPLSINFPLQCDVNESCIGGEIFITDFNAAPMIFNIQDMIDSLIDNPTKYFEDFNLSLFTVNLEAPLNIPVFKELVNLGGSNGLPPGTYMYDIRYVNADGDRTDFSPATPPIPVLENVSAAGYTFPHVRTFGAPADISNKTNYGIRLRFRVNNTSNFDFLEIRRRSYNLGVSNVLTPVSELVAKLDLAEGEIGVREFIDPRDSNVLEVLPEEDETAKLSLIKRAKGIRYHDKRLVLMNVEFESLSAEDLEFEDIGSEKAIPVVKKIEKAGHKDPFHHTYNKRYMGGEKYSFGINLFSSIAGTGFTTPIPGLQNFEFPNRRVALSADSKQYSYRGAARTATTTGSVDETFEVFDLENAVQRDDLCTFKNILEDGSKSKNAVNSAGCPDAGHGSVVSGTDIGYLPYRPVSQSDVDVSGLRYRVNYEVDPTGSSDTPYNPLGFAPSYYTTGIAIGGVTNIPASAKGFSIVRTDPAKRVIASGIGMYSLIEGDFNIVGNAGFLTKERNKLWFHSGDSKSFAANDIADVIANPNDYKIQVVSALGFFSEVYQFEQNTTQSARDRIIDMISYARILHDEGQINPTESGIGVPDGGKNYVAHNKYRNPEAASGGVFGGDGDTLLDISSMSVKTDNNSSYFEIELAQNIYNHTNAGGGQQEFADPNVKEWHEPFYIVNIINVGAEITDQNIDTYKGTGHFQKIESIIGIGNGTADQTFDLVDERWEDCIPDLSSTGSFAGDDFFVCMRDPLGIDKSWINVTFKTPAEQTTIITNIGNDGFHVASNGTKVYGLYTHTNSSDRDFSLVFNVPGFVPTENDTIVVKYDTRKPIAVYGGDTVVAENIFSPISKFNDDDNNTEDQFVFNMAFPFREFRMNPRHFVVRDGSATLNKIQDNAETALGYIRQLAVMFAAESRAAINYSHNLPLNPDNQYFPLINYVMRPNGWDGFDLGTNNVFSEYATDYGSGESSRWPYGGFRFIQNINVDYSYDGPLQFFSKPDFGFEEETEFCTAVIWSLPRAVNVQDSPGLKTFPTENRRDIADDQGEIKKAWDATTGGKGENLYAITETGVCLLLTKKAILSNIDADDLTTTAVDEFVSGEYWISKEIGSNDEFWRGMGEGTIGFIAESGQVEKEVLFFPNKESVYSLIENQIKDILRPTYHSEIKPFLDSVEPGYGSFMTGVINKPNNEYWLDIDNKPNQVRELFVYGNENGLWEGRFDYKHDQYFMSGDKLFGSRDVQTMELDRGFLINGSSIRFEILIPFTPGGLSLEKEFIRVGLQTGLRGTMKPTRIEFYDTEMTLLCSLDQFGQGVRFLKQYDAWEQFIGRKDAAVSPTRDRVQGRTIIVKIIHTEDEDFKLISTTMQYKILK